MRIFCIAIFPSSERILFFGLSALVPLSFSRNENEELRSTFIFSHRSFCAFVWLCMREIGWNTLSPMKWEGNDGKKNAQRIWRIKNIHKLKFVRIPSHFRFPPSPFLDMIDMVSCRNERARHRSNPIIETSTIYNHTTSAFLLLLLLLAPVSWTNDWLIASFPAQDELTGGKTTTQISHLIPRASKFRIYHLFKQTKPRAQSKQTTCCSCWALDGKLSIFLSQFSPFSEVCLTNDLSCSRLIRLICQVSRGLLSRVNHEMKCFGKKTRVKSLTSLLSDPLIRSSSINILFV